MAALMPGPAVAHHVDSRSSYLITIYHSLCMEGCLSACVLEHTSSKHTPVLL